MFSHSNEKINKKQKNKNNKKTKTINKKTKTTKKQKKKKEKTINKQRKKEKGNVNRNSNMSQVHDDKQIIGEAFKLVLDAILEVKQEVMALKNYEQRLSKIEDKIQTVHEMLSDISNTPEVKAKRIFGKYKNVRETNQQVNTHTQTQKKKKKKKDIENNGSFYIFETFSKSLEV